MSSIAVEKRDELEELADVADRARRLKKEIENILYTLKSVYGDRAQLSVLIEGLVEEYKPPIFEGEEVKQASNSLREYVSKLERILKDLTVKARNLEYIYNMLDKVENNVKKLEQWAELVKDVSDYRYYEASRVLEKYDRLFSKRLALPELVSRLAVLNDEIIYCLKKCRTAYLKKIGKAREELASGFKILEKAMRVASIEEASKVNSIAERFREFKNLLDRAEREAPVFKLDLNTIFREVGDAIEYLRSIASRDLSEKELAVLGEASRILLNHSMRYDSFLEILSRNCGYDIGEVQQILYILAKKNLLKINVKVE